MTKRRSIPPESSKSQNAKTITDNEMERMAWFSSVALFGDSCFGVVASFSVLCTAVLVRWYFTSTAPHAPSAFSTYESLGSLPVEIPSQPKIYHVNVTNRTSIPLRELEEMITNEMHSEYERDGVICIRGLITQELLLRLDSESDVLVQEQIVKNKERSLYHRRGTQFHTVTHSAIFQPNNTTMRATNNTTSSYSEPSFNAFMDVALWSHVPAFAAALLRWNSSNSNLESKSDTVSTHKETLRVIRDIFLAKDDDTYVCGWHVDDLGFWPATPDSSVGINAWIALDDMVLTEETGGFAVAVQSHKALWKDLAHYLTGVPTVTSFPKNGYQNVSHMFQERTGYGTCNIQKIAPHIHRRLEETSRIYPVRRGDVVFHTRWLFHRTVPISQTKGAPVDHPSKVQENDLSNQIYRRYSIRYGLGTSTIIPPGYGTELSVLYNESNGGLSANRICQMDGPWYPQAFPLMTTNEMELYYHQLQALIQEKLPIALRRQIARKQEMRPYLKQLAKEQHRLSTMGQ